MNTVKTTFDYKATQRDVNELQATFCPYGYMDLEAALNHAINAGETIDWVYEQVESSADSCGVSIKDTDPVYCVMDSILQHSRNEIYELTGFDIQNDASFDTHGNFMCSSFDQSEEDIQLLTSKLKEYEVNIEDLDQMTQYYLSEIGIDQEMINE